MSLLESVGFVLWAFICPEMWKICYMPIGVGLFVGWLISDLTPLFPLVGLLAWIVALMVGVLWADEGGGMGSSMG